jgi:hypothetical protein
MAGVTDEPGLLGAPSFCCKEASIFRGHAYLAADGGQQLHVLWRKLGVVAAHHE